MAGFNISGFRSNGPVDGGARPSLFSVNLTFPSIGEIPSAAEAKVTFMVKSASLPQSLINKVPIAYFGRKINVAGDRDFTDWQVTVYNDEDFFIRDAFEAWHNSINTIISNRLDPRVANIIPQLGNSYKTMGTVTQFQKVGPGDIDGEGSIKTYEFDGMFPTQVDAIRLDWEDGNRIEVFDVTFALDWWIPLRRANDVPIFAVELNPA